VTQAAGHARARPEKGRAHAPRARSSGPDAGAIHNSASVFPACRKRRLKGKWPDGAGVRDVDTPKPSGIRVLGVLTATP